jgi:hypothetical protein
MVSRFVVKFLDKRQRDKYTELVTLIQKEERIRSQLQDSEQERSRTDIR